MQACVIFNPTAKGDKARHFRRHLDEFASQCAVKPTAAAGDARRLASEAFKEGFETIIAAGGDGTLNEVINGLVDTPGALERVRLGILPLGTVNVLARELRIPFRLEAAWQTIREGKETRIDLPRADYGGNGATQSRWFAQLAGAGLDARAVELVNWPLKKKIGPLAYVWAGLRALAGPLPTIQVAAGSQRDNGQLVLIGNGRLYGGNYAVFPDASLHDGLLEVCVFPRANWLTLAMCGPSLLLRGRLPGRAVRNLKAESVTLTSPGQTPFEVDGELIGHLPVTFTLRRSALRVCVPA